MISTRIYKYIFFLHFSFLFIINANAQTEEQEIKIILRAIGHDFLLLNNDSTSRILSIEKTNSEYTLQFENSFAFQPDNLLFSTFKILEKTNVNKDYIIEVTKCYNDTVVYSFNTKQNQPHCLQRELPNECYTFHFTVINDNSKKTASKKNIVKKNNYYMYAIYLIVITIIAGLVIYIKKMRSPSNIKIGNYFFDKKKMLLIINKSKIELSSKETDLLLLFISNPDKTLERDYILNIIWNDNGNYVGRTLDVFISKLRKKLQQDPNIKIVNIRGIGYKFTIN